MQELLKNAWQGWLSYTDKGKFAVLLLVVLLFLWFRREACKEKLLLVYTTIITGSCICPVTAAILMKYQTGFYAYEWIWSYVPITLLIAYGVVIFLHEQWEAYPKESLQGRERNKYYLPIPGLMMLGVLVLCGGFRNAEAESRYDAMTWEHVEAVLTAVEESMIEEASGSVGAGGVSATNEEPSKLCLWAPKVIMEAARAGRADVSLVYGRNMWDAALGAWFYEPYGETEQMLYLWMCNAESTGSLKYAPENGGQIDGAWCLQAAKAAGVNAVLLPSSIPLEEAELLANQTGHVLQQAEGYYLLRL